jgi:hypothetical protein
VHLFKNLFYYAVGDDKLSLSNMICQIKKVVVDFIRQFSIVTIVFLLVYIDYIHDWFLMAVHIIACCYCSFKAVGHFNHECVKNIVGLYK